MRLKKFILIIVLDLVDSYKLADKLLGKYVTFYERNTYKDINFFENF